MLNSIYDSQASQFQSQVFLKTILHKKLYRMLNSIYDSQASQFQSQVFLKTILHKRALQNVELNL